jgi:hypothetical protein
MTLRQGPKDPVLPTLIHIRYLTNVAIVYLICTYCKKNSWQYFMIHEGKKEEKMRHFF